MTDTQVTETETTTPVVDEAGAVEQAKPTRTPKVKPEPHRCLCASFELANLATLGQGADEERFATGCESTTASTFAQGHDARLVSFLVSGYLDGYAIRRFTPEGTFVVHTDPEDAAKFASVALGEKARKATENKQNLDAKRQATKDARAAKTAERAAARAALKETRLAEKASAKAAKDAAKKTPQVEVQAGSSEGDTPAGPEGTVKIKVGRWEYDATIDPATESAFYTDGAGDPQTVERDGYRLLTSV